MHVSNYCETQKMREKTVKTRPFMSDCVPDCYTNQEICEKYCLYKYHANKNVW